MLRLSKNNIAVFAGMMGTQTPSHLQHPLGAEYISTAEPLQIAFRLICQLAAKITALYGVTTIRREGQVSHGSPNDVL
jgi:hypothetical protein